MLFNGTPRVLAMRGVQLGIAGCGGAGRGRIAVLGGVMAVWVARLVQGGLGLAGGLVGGCLGRTGM